MSLPVTNWAPHSSPVYSARIFGEEFHQSGLSALQNVVCSIVPLIPMLLFDSLILLYGKSRLMFRLRTSERSEVSSLNSNYSMNSVGRRLPTQFANSFHSITSLFALFFNQSFLPQFPLFFTYSFAFLFSINAALHRSLSLEPSQSDNGIRFPLGISPFVDTASFLFFFRFRWWPLIEKFLNREHSYWAFR